MREDYINFLLERCEYPSSLDKTAMANLRRCVVTAISQKCHRRLQKLHLVLSSISAKTELETVKNFHEMQILAALVRTMLSILDEDDPRESVKLIPHGKTILELMIYTFPKGEFYTIDRILELWPVEGKPSTSILTRSLYLLDEVGLIFSEEDKDNQLIFSLAPRGQLWFEQTREG